MSLKTCIFLTVLWPVYRVVTSSWQIRAGCYLFAAGRMDRMISLSFFLGTFASLVGSFALFSSERGTVSVWLIMSFFSSLESFFFICSPTLSSPPLSFSFLPGEPVWLVSFFVLSIESLFSNVGTFLFAVSDGFFLECLSFLDFFTLSLSSDRGFFLRFLWGSTLFSWVQVFFRGDFFFFGQKRVVFEEEPPIADLQEEVKCDQHKRTSCSGSFLQRLHSAINIPHT